MHVRLPCPRLLLLLLAVALGGLLGLFAPTLAMAMKPLSDLFVGIIALCAPVVMSVLVCASASHLAEGRNTPLMFKAMLCWQSMSVVALLCALVVTLLLGPGLQTAGFSSNAQPLLPSSALQPPAILLLLLAALLGGLLIGRCGEPGRRLANRLDRLANTILRGMHLILAFAPLAAFAAVAFLVGRYGLGATLPLVKFIATVCLACLLYLLLLGWLLRRLGLSLPRLVGYLKEELLVVAATSSSVAVLPRLVDKLEALGCQRPSLRLLLSSGYQFNLNGSHLYIGCAIVFLAQMSAIPLGLADLGLILLFGLLIGLSTTSSAGSAFATLSVTLGALGFIPLDNLALLAGIERLMKCRSMTNVLGNCIACLLVARWQGVLDPARLEPIRH